MKFYCPQCKQPVLLKVGDFVIPHFAHQQATSCVQAFSEGESFEHLLGKQRLYSFFQKHADHVELEPLIHHISQRPDLLIRYHAKKIPIEFQCSTMPISRLEERTSGYQRAGLNPLWLLCTPEKSRHHPQGIGIFQFSKFQQSFFTHPTPEKSVLLTYHPQSDFFHYFSNLIHIAGKRFIGNHRKLAAVLQSVPFAQPKKPTEEEISLYFQLYKEARSKFLENRIRKNRKGLNDVFLKNCYEMRMLPYELPNWIGVPVLCSESFQEHDCEWQTAFVHFIRENNLNLSRISDHHVSNFIGRYDGNCKKMQNACLAYAEFLLASDVNLQLNYGDVVEDRLFNVLAGRFLALRSEY